MATRREKVILELQDDFTSGMARAAAATALLDKNLGSLSGSAVKSRRSMSDMNQPDALPAINRNAAATSNSINQLTGRLRLMVDAAAVLGPALVPLGAGAIPALSGMAAQLTMTAAAGGTAMLAFKGMGDGLKALNEYQLEPTSENLAKFQEAMQKLGPAGADFVRFLDSIGPQLKELQLTAREGMFPGVEDGITSLLDLLPQVDRIVGNVAGAMGQLAREAGAGLSGEGFTAFFDYMETEARPILLEMGRTIGNFAEGLANMLVGFAPLSADFSGGLLEMSRSFAEWSRGLEENDSFQAFIDYVQQSGPKVLDLLGSLVDAFVGIARAAAPIGDVVLPALTGILDAIALLANSDMGSMFFAAAAGLAAYSRAAGVAQAATSRLALTGTTGLGRLNEAASRLQTGMRVGGAAVGLMVTSMTDLDEKAGLSNTALGALMGSMAGPWGAAIGAGAGLVMDFAAANDEAEAAVRSLNSAISSGGTPTRAHLDAVSAQLDQLRSDKSDFWSVGPSEGETIFEKLSGDMNAVVGNEGEMINALNAGREAMHSSNDIAGILGSSIGKTGDEMRQTARDAAALTTELSILQGFFDKRSALRNYEASMDELGKALRNNSKAWSKDTEKGREHLDMLDAAGVSVAQVAEQLKGREQKTFIDQALREFGTLAKNASPAARREIRKVVDALERIDTTKSRAELDVDARRATDKTIKATADLLTFGKQKPKATLDANNEPAKGKVNSTHQLLNQLAGRKVTVQIDGDASGVFSAAASANSALNNIADEVVNIFTVRKGKADGGTIEGPRAPYGDKVLSLLAPGEEVISNRFGQADRHRELLRAINSNRYADGGTVGRVSRPYASAVAPTSTTRTVERVVERMPGTVVLNAPGLGRIVATVADQRIASNDRYRNRLDDRD